MPSNGDSGNPESSAPFTHQEAKSEVPFLVILGGSLSGTRLFIQRGESVRIGRALTADRRLPEEDLKVSRNHAVIGNEDGLLFLQDLKAKNCTFVNEVRITSRVALAHGDIIRLGRTKLRVDMPLDLTVPHPQEPEPERTETEDNNPLGVVPLDHRQTPAETETDDEVRVDTGPARHGSVREWDVFLSHSSVDQEVANAICQLLESREIRCWIAPRDIAPGWNYAEGIIEGITACPIFIVVLSAHSNESTHVLREVGRAVAKERLIIPVLTEPIKVNKSLEYYLSSQQSLDACGQPRSVWTTALLNSVQSWLNQK